MKNAILEIKTKWLESLHCLQSESKSEIRERIESTFNSIGEKELEMIVDDFQFHVGNASEFEKDFFNEIYKNWKKEKGK